MNSGVRDAHNLGWKLVAVLKGQMAANALLSYESERRDHAWALIKLALNLGVVMAPATVLRARLISAASRSSAWCRRCAIISCKCASSPNRALPKAWYSPEGKAGKLACGQMFPQPLLTDAQGRAHLLDTTIGAGFALIQYGDLPHPRLDELRHGLWDHLEAKRILILPAHVQTLPSIPGCTVLQDRENALKDLLGDSQKFLLLRPDRYVAAIFEMATQDPVADALQSLFGITLTNNCADQPGMAPVYP